MYLKFVNIFSRNVLSPDSYIQNGLYLNINGAFTNNIQNIVDGDLFALAAGTFVRNSTNNGWVLDGNTYYTSTQSYAPLTWQNCTIEYVIKLLSYSTAQGIFVPSGSNGACAFVQNNVARYSCGGQTGQKGWTLTALSGSMVSLSLNRVSGFENGVSLEDGGSVTLSQTSVTCVGSRTNQYKMSGELFAIRAYMRILTQEERLQNFAIDKKIFNL